MVNGELSTARQYAQLVEQAQPATRVPEFVSVGLANLPEPGAERWKYSPVNRLYDALIRSAERPPVQQPAERPLADLQLLKNQVDCARYPLALATTLALDSFTRHSLAADERFSPELPATGNHWLHVDVPEHTSATLVQRALDTPDIALGGAQLITVALGPGAKLCHSLCGTEVTGHQWRLVSVSAAADSSYQLHQLHMGGELERNDIHVRLQGAGARVSVTGALLCGGTARLDNQLVLEHQAPRCQSEARYHGLANQHGKLTFGGRIHILPDAFATDAKLSNPNLLLADSAEINTKPELEIYNDDVACAHGATVGQLDDDAVFYLRSRGISEAGAKALLLRGFVESALGGPDEGFLMTLTQRSLNQWAQLPQTR